MDIENLKVEAKAKYLKDICKQISELEDDALTFNEEALEEVLGGLVDALNNTDGEDYFGTEGWKHRFGYDN